MQNWAVLADLLFLQNIKKNKFYRHTLSCKGKGNSVPLQAWSFPKGSRKLMFPDFITMDQDGGKFVSLTHRPPLPPRNAPGTHFCSRLSRPQGHSAIGRILCQWNIPVTPAGIEPATVRFVAQHLNHCATAVPLKDFMSMKNSNDTSWDRTSVRPIFSTAP